MEIIETIRYTGKDLDKIFELECVDGIVKDEDAGFPAVMLKDEYFIGVRNVLIPGYYLCKTGNGRWIIYSPAEYKIVTKREQIKTMENENKTIKAYKGFDSLLRCRNFQYEVGETYEMDDDIKCCERGFHACENPLEVLSYYPPSNSRYCEVEQGGTVSKDSGDSKAASSKIHISCEIGLKGIIEAGINYIFDKVICEGWKKLDIGDCSTTIHTKDFSVATNVEDRSVAINTGDKSTAINTGHYSIATNTGYFSIAINIGDCSTTINTGSSSVAISMGYQSSTISTGKYTIAVNTGYSSITESIGDSSTAINSGNNSAAKVDGKESVAVVTGKDSKACGALGCWLVLTERGEWDGNTYPIKEVRAVKVDGETIMPDTWYQLIYGEVREVK